MPEQGGIRSHLPSAIERESTAGQRRWTGRPPRGGAPRGADCARPDRCGRHRGARHPRPRHGLSPRDCRRRLALDGERELTFGEADEVSIRLEVDAFRSVNVSACMAWAAGRGLFAHDANGRGLARYGSSD